jgi:hypothetical protein
MHDRILYRLTWLALALSLGHHLDHLVRGNAVGWPVTGEVNAFTASLVVYPIIATGLLAYHAGRVGPGFWALVSGGGAVFVSVVHFGPAAAGHGRPVDLQRRQRGGAGPGPGRMSPTPGSSPASACWRWASLPAAGVRPHLRAGQRRWRGGW